MSSNRESLQSAQSGLVPKMSFHRPVNKLNSFNHQQRDTLFSKRKPVIQIEDQSDFDDTNSIRVPDVEPESTLTMSKKSMAPTVNKSDDSSFFYRSPSISRKERQSNA